jgi:hypothetical protein
MPMQEQLLCWCSKSGDNILAATNFNGPTYAKMANVYETVIGTAANSCTNGVPPSTTGALTPQLINIAVIGVE